MAPLAPLGRERAMQLVREGRLPFSFGSPHPCTMILEQEGLFRIRELVVNEDEARAAAQAAFSAGGSWMPEHHYALAKPTGKIYAEASSREELLAFMSEMPWPKHW